MGVHVVYVSEVTNLGMHPYYVSFQCPQCGEQFDDKLIINLYAPENLWDGCLQVLSLARLFVKNY